MEADAERQKTECHQLVTVLICLSLHLYMTVNYDKKFLWAVSLEGKCSQHSPLMEEMELNYKIVCVCVCVSDFVLSGRGVNAM